MLLQPFSTALMWTIMCGQRRTYPKSQCVTIHKVKGEWGIFCNFAKTPIEIDGVVFKSCEHLFQMMKFKDPAVVSNIMKGVTSKGKRYYEIKKTAKSYEKEFRREDWGSMIVDAMKFCLQKKYEQCSAFREKLHESHGRFIVEDQTTWRKKKPDAWGVKPDGDNFTGQICLAACSWNCVRLVNWNTPCLMTLLSLYQY